MKEPKDEKEGLNDDFDEPPSKKRRIMKNANVNTDKNVEKNIGTKNNIDISNKIDINDNIKENFAMNENSNGNKNKMSNSNLLKDTFNKSVCNCACHNKHGSQLQEHCQEDKSKRILVTEFNNGVESDEESSDDVVRVKKTFTMAEILAMPCDSD